MIISIQRDCQISSRDADDKRTLLSDWTREATGHTQTKVVILDATFFDNYILAKILRDRLIPSRDIDDQIQQSDWLGAFQAITKEPNFSQKCCFFRIKMNNVMYPLQEGKKGTSMNQILGKGQKNSILKEFSCFFPKMRFF